MNCFKPIFASICVVSGLSVYAPAIHAGKFKIEHPRARPSLGVAKNSVIFFTIRNMTNMPDRLISVESDVAKKIGLHTSLKENGIFKMRPVKYVEIPANGTLELKSGGLHVMIVGVHSKLRIGDSFKLKLKFKQAKPMTITVPVLKIGARKKPDQMRMDGMKKKKVPN